MADETTRRWFAFFTEVGIIAQLSRAMFEARLPDGFNLPQFSVLNHLVRVKDGQTPQALARAFQVPKTSMTHNLSVLEGAGLIAMGTNPRDGRSKVVTITTAGRGFHEAAIGRLTPDVQGLARQFPVGEVGDLTFRLSILRQILDAARDG
jgi:DNA-binding MarR family transcriptional regulator